MSSDAFRNLSSQLTSRRVSRRGFLGGAAALGATAAITSPRLIVPVRAQDAKKVVFWTTFTDPDLTVMKNICDTFNAANTDVQVELTQIPPAQVTDVSKLITAVRGGSGPDVYHMDRFIVAQYAANGALQDLSELSGGADPLEGQLAFAAAEATYDGKPYALPVDTDTRALYYNKALVESAGATADELDPANGPITWDRLKEIALQLNKKTADGSNFEQTGFVPWFSQGWHYTYGFSWNGSFYNADECKVTPNDPPIVEAFQWVYDYCKEVGPQALQAFAGASTQNGFPPQQDYFTVGTTAFAITGDWHIKQMATYAPDLDYGITYIPVPKTGDAPSTWAGGWSVVIPQGAKEPEAAYKFMSYYAGPEGQKVYAKDTAHLPTIEALTTDKSLYDERHLFFAETLLPIAKNRPPLPVGAAYWDALTVAWQATYLNEEEPQKALDEAQTKVQGDLQRFC